MALPDPKPSPATAPGGTGSTNFRFWPLIVVIEDCYVPQSARLVLETISEQSDETCGVLFALAGMKASGEWSRN